MTWAVAWRPLAERDFTECTAHIAQDNTVAALRFVDAVEETVASLAENPMLSTATHFAHPDLAGIRRRVVNGFSRYLIFYRNESATQTVELVRILPGERDLPVALVETNPEPSTPEH
jgi:plasmid stabilization system protein ParE